MGTRDEVVEIESLERSLLPESVTGEDETAADDDEPVLYTASFSETEEDFVKYQTALWVRRPVPIPCFGVLQKEKHVLLPSVADVVVEQDYLQSRFGVYSLRIENVGVRRPPSDDVQIQGIANPNAFRKAVLTRLSNMRTEVFSRQVPTIEDTPNLRIQSPAAWLSPPRSLRHDAIPHSGDLALLQKLEEVGSSVKRVQSLIEEQHSQASETAD
ncbi:hypothetical protein PTKIN_Ptkin03bG0221400 [Pterospermum kingtungense]